MVYTIILDSSNTDLSIGIAKEGILIDYISYAAWQQQSEFMIKELDTLLNKYEVNDGKKICEFSKEKINLSFPKGVNDLYDVEVDNYGFILDKNEFDSVIFTVNPFVYDIYSVSVNISKKDKFQTRFSFYWLSV